VGLLLGLGLFSDLLELPFVVVHVERQARHAAFARMEAEGGTLGRFAPLGALDADVLLGFWRML
jgi:hypothetical protein